MVKIHIDTSTAEEQAKAQTMKQKAGTTAKKKSSSSPSSSTPSATTSPPMPGQQPTQQKPPVPTSPRKEPTPNDETKQARTNQTTALKARQNRELQGKVTGATREVNNTGNIFYPPLNPIY